VDILDLILSSFQQTILFLYKFLIYHIKTCKSVHSLNRNAGG